MTKLYSTIEKSKFTSQIIKTYLSILITISIINQTTAAVNNYTFASTSSNYTAIFGTTLFSGAWDDLNSTLLSIPFAFTYNGSSYTTLGVNSNGFITMEAITTTVYCGLQTSAPNSIAGYGTNLVGNPSSSVQYASRGVSPNRQFVIQWTDCKHYLATGDSYTFQIILNETSNTVQIVWAAVTASTIMGVNNCSNISTESGNVGLVGSSNIDFDISSITNGNTTWATSVNGGTLSLILYK
jgi:hypothetical protein